MRNRRLYSYAHQAIGVINRPPSVGGQLGAATVVGIAEVADIHAGTGCHQNFHHFGGTFVRGAMQRDAAGLSLEIRVDTQA